MSVFFSGVYAAAYGFRTEWVVVKGIKDFADETQSSSEKWNEIACVMAASVVANIFNDPVIFQDWPHFNAGIASCLNLVFLHLDKSELDLSSHSIFLYGL